MRRDGTPETRLSGPVVVNPVVVNPIVVTR